MVCACSEAPGPRPARSPPFSFVTSSPKRKIGPEPENRAEQRCHRPVDIHDPHALRMQPLVGQDDHGTCETQQEEGDRKKVKPSGTNTSPRAVETSCFQIRSVTSIVRLATCRIAERTV